MPETIQPAKGADSRRARHVPARRPLADAVAIGAIPVPQTAPPYDDAVLAPARIQAGPRAGRPTAPRSPSRAQPGLRAGIGPAASRIISSHDRDPVRPPTRRAGAGDWPGQLAQLLAEALAGARPADQLSAWTTEKARKQISQLGPLLAASNRPRVRRVIIASPADGVLEMTVIVALGGRIRALAVRLEQRPWPAARSDGREPQPLRWQCTQIEAA